MKQLADEFKRPGRPEPDSSAIAGTVLRLLQEGVRRWPKNAELAKAALEKPLYRETRTKECFLVLRGLAEEIAGKECPQIVRGTEAGKYSVEHVLPQGAITEGWSDDLKRWGEPSPLQLWSERKDVLGNLTLTAFNSELGQKRFEAKQAFFHDNRLSQALQANRGGRTVDAGRNRRKVKKALGHRYHALAASRLNPGSG